MKEKVIWTGILFCPKISSAEYYSACLLLRTDNNSNLSIRISCQCRQDKDGSYAWRIAGKQIYDELELRDMEYLIPVLRKIYNKLSNFLTDFGEPKTFGNYLYRICMALKVNDVIVHAEDDSFNETKVCPKDAEYTCDRIIRKYHEQFKTISAN